MSNQNSRPARAGKPRLFANISLLALSLSPSAFAQAAPAWESVGFAGRDEIVVTAPLPLQEQRPTTVESRSGEDIHDAVSVTNAEDALRYFPNIFVRKRHIGDTQAPITTRTSGVGASARSLIYADGVLLSALIGNNNTNASPKWGMVSPDEIARIDVLYGPFSAAYAGNSIGAVVEIETRMPDAREGSLSVSGSTQHFNQYATEDNFGAHQLSANFGDRIGRFSFWLGATRTESDSHPLTYVTAARPASPSGAGTVLTGAFADLNRTGAPIVVLGAGGLSIRSRTISSRNLRGRSIRQRRSPTPSDASPTTPGPTSRVTCATAPGRYCSPEVRSTSMALLMPASPQARSPTTSTGSMKSSGCTVPC